MLPIDPNDPRVEPFKLALGVLAVHVLLAALVVKRASWQKPLRVALYAVGVLGVVAWFNFLGTRVHVYEHYHYQIGARYADELRYDAIYECSLVAMKELGARDDQIPPKLRDLVSTGLLEPSADVVAHPEACHARFTPERWAEFVKDIDYYSHVLGPKMWATAVADHGYNGTPWWTVVGHAVMSVAGPASRGQLLALSMIDPVLVILAFAAIAWAFGPVVFAASAVFLAVDDPARFAWIGGAFIRQDYLCATVLGVCLVKKGWPMAGGGALAWAAASRLFPGAFLIGPAIQAGVALVRRQPVPRETARLLAGAALVGALVAPLPLLISQGDTRVYGQYVTNMERHLSTPLSNNMGLPFLLSWRPGENDRYLEDPKLEDPAQKWKETQVMRLSEARPVWVLVLVAVFAVLVSASRRQPAWAMAALSGVAVIVAAISLTGYYTAIFLIGAALAERRPAVATGAVLTGLATHLAAPWTGWQDEKSLLASVVFGIAAALLLAAFARPAPADDVAPAPPS